MRLAKFSIAVLVCSLAAITPNGYSQYPKTHPQPPGGVDGSVIDWKGAPVSGAQVLWQASDGGKPHVLHSDAKGEFHVPKLRPGLYDVRASKGNVQSGWTHNLLVRPGTPTAVMLKIETAQSKKPASPKR
jgi:hypothetical protein